MKSENTLRMEKCPRFQSCSIPKCPIDEDMNQRIELPKDPICPLRRKVEGKRRAKVEGRLAANWRKLAECIPSVNLKK
jgi:hypothetical protein